MNNKFSYGFKKTLSSLLSEHVEDISFDIPENTLENFHQTSLKICELEALTFKTQENKDSLDLLMIKFKEFTDEFNNLFLSSRVNEMTEKQWRFFAGLFCCFMEWCEDVYFFTRTKQEQDFILQENPLTTGLYF